VNGFRRVYRSQGEPVADAVGDDEVTVAAPYGPVPKGFFSALQFFD
jgi:hypothetical protein